MKLPIITADERLRAKKGITMAIFGETGIGKTSLLKTSPEATLCLDMEAGLLAVPDWKGDTLRVKDWDMARDMACLIGGVNPTSKDPHAYSPHHYQQAKNRYGDPSQFDAYSCLFIDSITVASRLCLQWCKHHLPRADLRAAYGLMASEMMLWLTQFQQACTKDIIFVGILEKRSDETQGFYWALQIEGAKIGLELPGIVDEVLILVRGKPEAHGRETRRFVCKATNTNGYPAKDRSGKLALEEPAHLSAVLAKIKGQHPSGPPQDLLPKAGKAYPPVDATSHERINPHTGDILSVSSQPPAALGNISNPLEPIAPFPFTPHL